ncbi:unnamed protein product [Cylicocyclus nassatus]|uniref:LisH domain-containing protein n=1 Tax=Cylicocyclus nassatus TaxID=53992 RepID=A0AA36DVR7_CYLNA|nr:unnamed protein product [Cylicocyclus nassatus]
MSAEFKKDAANHILEQLHETEVFKFIQSLIRESVLRILRPEAALQVKKLSDQDLICHSMIYHFLNSSGYKAAAEVMQAECYEKFLTRDYLHQTIESYEDDSVTKSLAKFQAKAGLPLKRAIVKTNETPPLNIFKPKPDGEFEDTKESLRGSVMEFAKESVEKKQELRQQEEEEVSDEEVEGEDEEESGSEEKSSSSSTTAESEPPSHLPPLTGSRPKPQLTSIKSIDFDIPQLEKSPSTQSVETPIASPSPIPATTSTNEKGETEKKPPDDVEELSEIESLTGIDQLLESDRSGSISF